VRVAHFFALHAHQAIPLAWLLLVGLGGRRALAGVLAASAAYVGLIGFTFVQALAGRPFLPGLG
jgi:hypothetical protein